MRPFIFIFVILLFFSFSYAVVETPLWSDSIIDRWCVAANFPGIEAQFGNKSVGVNLIKDLGLRTYRSEFYSDNALYTGSQGLRTIALIPMAVGTSTTDVQQFINTVGNLKVSAKIDSIEGPNEPNLFWLDYSPDPFSGLGWRYNGKTWKQGIVDITRDIYTFAKNNPSASSIPIIGAAFSQGHDVAPELFQNGVLSPWVTWGNSHPYPTTNGWVEEYAYHNLVNYFFLTNLPVQTMYNERELYPNLRYPIPYVRDTMVLPFYNSSIPVCATETGYSTQVFGTSVRAHGKYIPRLLMEAIRLGWKRTCIYQLLNDAADYINLQFWTLQQ